MLAAALSLALIISQPLFAGYPAQNRNRINGRVAGTDDKPIENVRVTLLSDRLTQAGVEYTDSSGRFSFENVARGIYSVLVEPSGAEYERQSVQIEVNPFVPIGQGGSETYRVDFVLRREVRSQGRVAAGDRTVFYQDVPSDAKKQYRRALEGLKKGDFEGATKALARALEIFPDYYEALELLGTEYVKARDYQAAIAPLSHAIEVNQDDWRSFYSLGIALIEVKRPGDAIKPLSRAVELNSTWAYTHLRLGIAKGQTENTGEAIEALKVAIKIGGEKVPEAYLHLAFVYNKTKQYQEAALALDSYLKVSRRTGQRPDEQEYYERLLEQLRQKAAGAPKN